MRREFELGPEDVRALDALGLTWETVRDGGVRWILIHDHPIPAGFSHLTACAAIRIDTYPPGIIDMVYFYPPLARSDGKAINNLSVLQIDGKAFQQWSRHYGWRSGIDTLCSHLRRVRAWLKHELRKR
ncbi:MAG: E2/UBC family protein [Phenylobacterium sp.]|uniref:E2/UBC family protein n=1 Tax=Phenylobacterium sp. TaxID=1871053 RepID=UPI00273246F7|nr:E2/UBC family protein [Phenylobacterium sp.]MDP3746635.1 E2/UBC family protein [Phenylobacterium sp.]